MTRYNQVWDRYEWYLTGMRQVWAVLVKYEDRHDKVWNWYDRVWPGMSRCDLVWPGMSSSKQVWPGVQWDWYDQVWPRMETYDQVWTHMTRYEAGMQNHFLDLLVNLTKEDNQIVDQLMDINLGFFPIPYTKKIYKSWVSICMFWPLQQKLFWIIHSHDRYNMYYIVISNWDCRP